MCLGEQNGCLREGLMSPSSPWGGAVRQAACFLLWALLPPRGAWNVAEQQWFLSPQLVAPGAWCRLQTQMPRAGEADSEEKGLLWPSSAFPGHS